MKEAKHKYKATNVVLIPAPVPLCSGPVQDTRSFTDVNLYAETTCLFVQPISAHGAASGRLMGRYCNVVGASVVGAGIWYLIEPMDGAEANLQITEEPCDQY